MRVLGLFTFAILVAAGSTVRADGLIYRLPPDGTWVRYVMRQEGELVDLKVPDDFPAKAKKEFLKTFAAQGTFTISSVGMATVDGKKCRWIEIVTSSEATGKTVGGKQADKHQRTIVLKLLIPEDRLVQGEDPFAHVLKMYFKDRDRMVKEITDAQRKKYELDRFRQAFPEPVTEVYRTPKQTIRTESPVLGSLECERLSFASKYDGPLAGGKGRWTWQGEHQVWLSDRVPFGVAALELQSESKEATGQNESLLQTTKGTIRLVVSEYGEDAQSRLPDSN